MGLFMRRESQEKMDNLLKKYINEDILFDGKKKTKKEEEELEEKEKSENKTKENK